MNGEMLIADLTSLNVTIYPILTGQSAIPGTRVEKVNILTGQLNATTDTT